ncbi:MAG: gamma-glutamylcyclotransferase family protein [Nitrospirales bacterium]
MTLVFGYGSLIDTGSRTRTVPSATQAWPIEMTGLKRDWNARTGPGEIATTFLGAYEHSHANVNGVAFFANDSEVQSLIRRETGYVPTHFPLSRVHWWTSPPSALPESILIFCFASKRRPSRSYPIIQSYVDICLSGCLAVDASLQSSDSEFSRRFLRGTSGWSKHWVNDRRRPRVSYRHSPQTSKIDELISSELPAEIQVM